MRKPGEPIYLRRHMIGLVLALCLPLVLLQLYKIYIGPISFGMQLIVGFVVSIAAGIALYLAYRRTARNEP
jgi:hypothetical protein